jgi:Carboxypeptidase regulatory-like domain
MQVLRKELLSMFIRCAILLACTVAPLAGQIGGTGTVKGTVTDPTGAVIPNANVTAANTATGVETRRETTSAGLYVIAPLPRRHV